MSNEIDQLKTEIQTLKQALYELQKEVIVHRQHVQQRSVRDLSGYVTIPNLDPSTVAQLDDNTILVVQTADGTKRAYLSEIFSKLDADDIPDLDANKITSGTFGVARIPDLDAGKITSGIFSIERIPDLDASKITSGTFGVARIPAANNSDVVGSGFGGYRYTVSGTTMNLFTS